MRRNLWYMLKDGKPEPADIVSPEYLKWSSNADNRRVARTDIAKDIWVSTVFLCLDHNHFSEGEPILWETMIFGGVEDMSQWRATSQEESLEHHKEAVALAQKALNREDSLIKTKRRIQDDIS